MINVVREGRGRPLLLVHGLGGSWRSWSPILAALALRREVVAIDLPGHGGSPAEADSGTFAGLTASLECFILAEGMENVAAVGSSMGARLVLEMARRGRVGGVVALDAGGFWRGWEHPFFGATIGASIKLVRALAPALPAMPDRPRTHGAAGSNKRQTMGFEPGPGRRRTGDFAATQTFDALVHDLFDRAGADRAGRALLRPCHDRLGPAGPTLPSRTGKARKGRLSGRRDALVRAQRAFSSLG